MNRALPRSVLVTGATGFLGGHVCQAFAERGIGVRALVRRPSGLTAAGIEPWPIRDLADTARLGPALTGIEAVVHLAAHVHQGSVPADGSAAAAAFRTVNVDGTRTLLEAAMAAGVRDFVFASSVKVVGEGGDTPWTEDTPPAPADAYGVTKLEAERLVRDRAVGHRLHAPVLRLPLVYGPGMKANALRLFDAVARGTPLPLGAVHNRRSLLFVGNLIAAIFATLQSEGGSDTFFVSDAEDVSTPELVRAIARALERPARLVPVPIGLLRTAARTGDLLAGIVPFPLTSAALDRLVGSLAVDSSRLARSTGYRPPYSLTDGLRITAEWYRSRVKSD
jgi:nucleoside-diphosphate-sugar epimerase